MNRIKAKPYPRKTLEMFMVEIDERVIFSDPYLLLHTPNNYYELHLMIYHEDTNLYKVVLLKPYDIGTWVNAQNISMNVYSQQELLELITFESDCYLIPIKTMQDFIETYFMELL